MLIYANYGHAHCFAKISLLAADGSIDTGVVGNGAVGIQGYIEVNAYKHAFVLQFKIIDGFDHNLGSG